MRNGTIAAVAAMVAAVALTTGCDRQPPGGIPSVDGTYSVGFAQGNDVAPGTYRTVSERCQWEVEGDLPRSGTGPVTLWLNDDHDFTIVVRGCGVWLRIRG